MEYAVYEIRDGILMQRGIRVIRTYPLELQVPGPLPMVVRAEFFGVDDSGLHDVSSLSAEGQVLLYACFFVLEIGRRELLGEFYSKQILNELGLLETRPPNVSMSLKLDLACVGNVHDDRFSYLHTASSWSV